MRQPPTFLPSEDGAEDDESDVMSKTDDSRGMGITTSFSFGLSRRNSATAGSKISAEVLLLGERLC